MELVTVRLKISTPALNSLEDLRVLGPYQKEVGNALEPRFATIEDLLKNMAIRPLLEQAIDLFPKGALAAKKNLSETAQESYRQAKRDAAIYPAR